MHWLSNEPIYVSIMKEHIIDKKDLKDGEYIDLSPGLVNTQELRYWFEEEKGLLLDVSDMFLIYHGFKAIAITSDHIRYVVFNNLISQGLLLIRDDSNVAKDVLWNIDDKLVNRILEEFNVSDMIETTNADFGFELYHPNRSIIKYLRGMPWKHTEINVEDFDVPIDYRFKGKMLWVFIKLYHYVLLLEYILRKNFKEVGDESLFPTRKIT